MSQAIIYEQPLNELVRVCLRLECLFQQAAYDTTKVDHFGGRAALQDIIEIINVLDRPNFRNKITSELLHYREIIQRLTTKASVSQAKATEILGQLDEDIRYLESTSGKFAQNLRNNQFLNTMRYAMARPGGVWSFDIPLYHYWLEQNVNERQADFKQWWDELLPIQKITQRVLTIIRGYGQPKQLQAIKGFNQFALDGKLDYQLVQLWLPKTLALIPEISVGKHRLSLRFLKVSYEKRLQQTDQDVSYTLKISVL